MGLLAAEVEQILQAARLHLAKGEFHEAVRQSTEVINRDAKRTSAYLVRAEAHRRLKKPERALADIAVAIRLDPHQPGPYLIRAEILKRRNQFDQAIADVTHALIVDPRNAGAFSIRAECRSAIGDQDGAHQDVQEMVVIDPTRPVPNLQAKSASGHPAPTTAMEEERSWKQSGTKGSDDTSLFADGMPVDKTYQSRRGISDENVPEALGVASGYKPETISTPIPRIRAGQKRNNPSWLVVGLLGVGLAFAAGISFATRNSAPIPDVQAVAVRSSDPDVKSARSVEADQQRLATPAVETPSGRSQNSRTQRPDTAPPEIADAVPSIRARGATARPPDDAVSFNGHAYKFFPEVLPWHLAKARCEEMGGHLATIATRDENNFVLNIVLRRITRLGPSDGVWLGATDERKEGAWEWVDGSKLFFNQWGPGQPNNKQNQEHYLLLFLPKNQWADQPNQSTQHVAYFACEWDGGLRGGTGSEGTFTKDDAFVAHWVWSKGGKLSIEMNDSKSVVQISPTDDLPQTGYQIVTINLTGITVSDHEVKAFAHLTRVEEINLWKTGITDAAMPTLTTLKSLKTLNLQDTEITDEGLSQIESMTNLRSLNVAGLSLGSRGLSHVGQLTKLETLLLGGVQANDDAIAQLSNLTNLRLLGLHFNFAATNAAIPRLRKLQRLETIRLKDTNVSDDVVRRNLPGCKIER